MLKKKAVTRSEITLGGDPFDFTRCNSLLSWFKYTQKSQGKMVIALDKQSRYVETESSSNNWPGNQALLF